MITNKAGIKALQEWHGGQDSPSYAVLSSIILMMDDHTPLAPSNIYSLPFLAARNELIKLHNSNASSSLRVAIKYLDNFNGKIERASIAEQQQFYYRNFQSGRIWHKNSVPWFFKKYNLSGEEFIWIPEGAGLTYFDNMLLDTVRVKTSYEVFGARLVVMQFMI